MGMNKASIRQAKYDKKATKQFVMRLNIELDCDILKKLDAVENKQGYIKELIRKDIQTER